MWEVEMLTMGDWQRVYILVGTGGGGHVFWVGRIAPSKKFKLPRSGKIINICAVKMWQQEVPAKIVMGGKPNNAPPPMQKRRPPPLPHGKNDPHVERKDCPHRKNIPLGEPPPHIEFFYSCPPGERLLFPPCVRRSWSPLTLFRLFERIGKKKIKQIQNFLAFSLNFFLEGECIVSNTHNLIYRWHFIN